MARPTRLLAPLPTRLLGFVCILLLVSSARSPVLAQALGTLTVTARDLNGNPVANARISIARPGDDSLTATTADNGVATFDDLIPGQYYVNGVASGLTLFPDRMSASISVDVSSGQDAALAVVFFPRNPMDDAYDERTMAIVMEHVRSTRSSTVERDTGQFRNFRNDTLLSETSVDNTVAAARDIQLDSTENAIAIGGQFTFPLNPSVFVLGSGSFLAQPTALTINTVQGSSTEVSGGTPIG